MKWYGREKGWRSVNVKLKKNIKNSYKKMERKKIMTWMLTWLNVSVVALNATFQFLVIYRFWSDFNFLMPFGGILLWISG